MAMQQQCKTVEMAANDTKMAWNCDNNKEKHKYWQGQGMKASNDEVKLSEYHGNNKVTQNSESQRTRPASTSFVSPQIVMGSTILRLDP